MKFRKPDVIKTIPADGSSTTKVYFEGTDIYVQSADLLKFITIRWNFTPEETGTDNIKILGDDWERAYGTLAWRGIEPDRVMPWYFAVTNGSDSCRDYTGRFTECFGVETQPNAFCSWKYDNKGISLILDVRNLGAPVELGGRTLHAAKVIFSEYKDCSAFEALCGFCKEMCPAPLEYDGIIYGSNNWYYAYGKSSREEIIKDSEIIAELCSKNKSRPFMVIDDGWQMISTEPEFKPNSRFGDMKTLAEEMTDAGVIPGIWVRFLTDEHHVLDLPEEARLGVKKQRLDPTHPAAKEYVKNLTNDLIQWGYKLIKHDFSSFDITNRWGKEMDAKNTKDGCGLYDRSITTAEAVKDFYKLILENAGDAVILGCNTFSHLSAGLVHANRTGDDTSGNEWARTRKMGVNTLAFRLCQNGAFYAADADCVGITGNIDWAFNSQWLTLLAHSGTALFVSCRPSEAKGEIYSDLADAFVPASQQKDELIPLDWMENSYPCRYLINGEEVTFDWFGNSGDNII